MEATWNKYKNWLASNFPEGIAALNAGATDEELVEVESVVGLKLSPDYRKWLAIHNGEHHDGPALLCSNEFLSTSRIIYEWKTMVEIAETQIDDFTSESNPPDAIRPDWWNRSWIPISSDGSGNLECIDLAPGPAGTVGQIIDFDHETTDRTVLASSFREWVSQFVNDVADGNYAYSVDYGRFMLCDEM